MPVVQPPERALHLAGLPQHAIRELRAREQPVALAHQLRGRARAGPAAAGRAGADAAGPHAAEQLRRFALLLQRALEPVELGVVVDGRGLVPR